MIPNDHLAPCESPIEKWFWEKALIFPATGVRLDEQVDVQTLGGFRFRHDFTFTKDERTIAIELDGKDFHDKSRDELRDGLILGSGFVGGSAKRIDAIYRVTGRAIFHHFPKVFDWLDAQEPGLLSPRAREIIKRQIERRGMPREITEEGTAEYDEIEPWHQWIGEFHDVLSHFRAPREGRRELWWWKFCAAKSLIERGDASRSFRLFYEHFRAFCDSIPLDGSRPLKVRCDSCTEMARPEAVVDGRILCDACFPVRYAGVGGAR